MNTNEFRVDEAEWIGRVYTKDDWLTSVYNVHALFSVPGVTILTASVDFMHTKYIGVDAYFYASVLTLLCYYVLPQDAQTNLNRVWKVLHANCKRPESRNGLRRLLLSTFSNKTHPFSNMPCFKAKAAAMKGLAGPLLITFKHFARECPALPSTQLTQIMMALESSHKLDTIIDDYKEEYVYPAAVYAEFKGAGFRYMVLFNALGRYYSEVHEPAMKLFDVTIKAHMLCHCVLQAEFVNPRLGWCYYGEDFMQKMHKLLQCCCLSNAHVGAMNESLLRYSVALHILFTEIAEGYK
jgi:hypothetical protein